MTNKRSLTALAALLLTALGGNVAFAQTAAPPPPTPQAPAGGPGMMQREGMMGRGGSMGQIDMTEMKKMMEGCNKMMERAAQTTPSNSGAPG